MTSPFDQTNHFTDCNIDFPSRTYCGKVLNDIFKQGLSINQFEDKYKRITRTNIVLPKTSYQSSVQYNITTDIYGPKEFVIVHRDGTDYQAGIVYGIRQAAEYNTVANFLATLPIIELAHETPGNKIFSVNVPYTNWERTREVVLGVQRYTEQATFVSVMLNF